MGKAVLCYLDCGCAIMEDGERIWCPSCSEPSRKRVTAVPADDVKPYTGEELPTFARCRNDAGQWTGTYRLGGHYLALQLDQAETIARLLATARAGIEDRERMEAFAKARIGLSVPEIQDVLQIATAGEKVSVGVAFAVNQLLARMAEEGIITIAARGSTTPSGKSTETAGQAPSVGGEKCRYTFETHYCLTHDRPWGECERPASGDPA